MEQKGESEALSWLKAFVIASILVFIVRYFFFVPVTVYGESMLPTFEDHDKVIVSKTSTIDRFDEIVFKAPDVAEGENVHYIKRVIGLPGDKIEMKDDILYINGKPYKEDYVNRENVDSDGKVNYDFTLEELTGETMVPENCYFVLGDNRQVSNDSREFGFIHKDSVIGEVKFRIYPFKHFGKV